MSFEYVRAFVDLETTGLDPRRHEIIEVGCIVAVERGIELEVMDGFAFKVHPERIEAADPVALSINGYSPEQWHGARDLHSAMHELASRTRGMVLVGHNIAFDWRFLERAFERTGVAHALRSERIDVCALARRRLAGDPHVTGFSLSNMCAYFDIENENPHAALADIRATYELYGRLLEMGAA
jgi:DNA polymerase III subunit epsilon